MPSGVSEMDQLYTKATVKVAKGKPIMAHLTDMNLDSKTFTFTGVMDGWGLWEANKAWILKGVNPAKPVTVEIRIYQ